MKKTRRLLTFALFASAAALLIIIICAPLFRWGLYLPVQYITPEEMVSRLKTSNNVDYILASYIVNSDGKYFMELQTRFGFRYITILKSESGISDWNITEANNEARNLVIQILEEERGLKSGKDFRLHKSTMISVGGLDDIESRIKE